VYMPVLGWSNAYTCWGWHLYNVHCHNVSVVFNYQPDLTQINLTIYFIFFGALSMYGWT